MWIIFLLTVLVTIISLPFYIKLLNIMGCVQNNYQLIKIPIGVGFFLFLIQGLILLIYQDNYFFSYWPYLLLIVSVGTYDDLFGEKKIKGLNGHIKSFFHGKITSGFIKAFTGGLVALIIGIKLGDSIYEYLINFLLISLMLNAINLFDLRPGRALKVFFVLMLILGSSTYFLSESRAGIVLLGISLLVFYYDINGKIMLGDSGANILGLHLGIWYCEYFSIYSKNIIVLVLILIHIYAEMFSFSELIENNRVLKSLDLWGRRKNKNNYY